VQIDHPAYRLGIFGGSGSGKTTFALKVLANLPAKVRFIFDPEGEFSHRLGLPLCQTFADLDREIGTGWICFDPFTEFETPDEGFAFFTRYAFELSQKISGRKLFMVDELQEHIDGHKIPPELSSLVWRGRRRGLDSIFIGQSPNLLNNRVRLQLTEVVCFQMTDDTALEFPRGFGFDVEEVRRLPQFRFVCRTKRGACVRG
jgi:DNA helicase HerA-like ATPase